MTIWRVIAAAGAMSAGGYIGWRLAKLVDSACYGISKLI
jgi:hypothetical protein